MPLSALLLLTGCATCEPIIEYRDVIVEKPVVQPLPGELLADCPPDFALPARGSLTVDDALSRLESLETAVSECRKKLQILRETYAPGGNIPTPSR